MHHFPPSFYSRITGGSKHSRMTVFSRIIRAFSRFRSNSDGGDSTAARRGQQAPVLPLRGGGFAAGGLGQVSRAPGLLRSKGAGGSRGAARKPRAREALAGARRPA